VLLELRILQHAVSGLGHVAHVLGSHSPTYQAMHAWVQLERSRDPNRVVAAIGDICTCQGNPVVSVDNLSYVENVAVPADLPRLRRITITH
jgi:hypothetical protein